MIVPERQRSRSEMLPLMDVIFMLMVLFIFMLVQMRPDFGMSVELPQVREGQAAPARAEDVRKRHVWVSVDRQNALYVNRAAVAGAGAAAQAVERLAAGARREDVRIIFKGDRQADFGVVIAAYSALREAGYVDVLFDCERETGGASEN